MAFPFCWFGLHTLHDQVSLEGPNLCESNDPYLHGEACEELALLVEQVQRLPPGVKRFAGQAQVSGAKAGESRSMMARWPLTHAGRAGMMLAMAHKQGKGL